MSNRFIFGDRESRKLSVVGERTHNVTNLASASTAGFREIASLAIDAREGDLWVVELGRWRREPPQTSADFGPRVFRRAIADNTSARFADVSVTPQSTVMALDDVGRRLFRIRPGSRELDVGWVIEAQEPVSVAALSEAVVYVAHREGIARIDLASGHERPLRPRDGIELTGILHPPLSRRAGGRSADVPRRVPRCPDHAGCDGTRASAVALLDKEWP